MYICVQCLLFKIVEDCIPDYIHEEHSVTFSEVQSSCKFSLLLL